VRRTVLAALLTATVALGAADRVAADADQLYPLDLRVLGGDAWHSEPSFELRWDRPPVATEVLPVAAVHYRIRDAAGGLVKPSTRLAGDRDLIGVQVPPVPGQYTADVWLEGAGGEYGPTRSVVLGYDHGRPGTARPLAPAGWIAGSVAATISVQPPPGPAPVSGVRGYAVSVDHGGESWPCASRSRCEEADVDLPATAAGPFSLGTLPEGITVVRAVAVSGAGVPSAESGSAVVRVDATPPAVSATGAPSGWANGPVTLLAKATDSLSGMSPAGPNGPYTGLTVDGGVPRTELGDSAAVTVSGEGLHRVELLARDAVGNARDRRTGAIAVSIDESPPRVAFAGSQDPAQPERIEATVADALSGTDPARGTIGVREAGTSQPWQPLPTAAASGRLVARWDSGAYPEGVYEFRATAFDLAGNAGSSNQRENHTRMALVNPLKIQPRLQARLAGAGPLRFVPYGHRVVYSGRLTAAGGAPLGGLPVLIVESFGPGAAAAERSRQAVTAADGGFSVRLPPGPSRRVEARFAATRTLGAAASEQAQLGVLSAVSMRASKRTATVGGAPVVFSGRVGRLGAELPAVGLAVELQFKAPGEGWAEFRTVQTDARGRFRYAYAFSDDDSRGVRFQFRAYINRGGWPYEPAASNGVAVRGR
jgi:hypothetical protein